MIFSDRAEAGRRLAEALDFLRGRNDLLVLGIPRGGVVVAYEVARALRAPLDLWVAHKIGAPGNPELGIGSVSPGSDALVDAEMVRRLGVPAEYLAAEIEREEQEIARRLREYRGDRPLPSIENKAVVLIDDGIATGSTARAALRALRSLNPAQLLLAVPVAPADVQQTVGTEADRVVVLSAPSIFYAVGQFYEQFGQTEDAEVIALLRQAERDLQQN